MRGGIKYQITQWAEMSPDVYGGAKCDKIVPRWKAGALSDMGDSDTLLILKLAARTFPPGTKITIEEPACPTCGELREPIYPMPSRKPIFSGPCTCGFDWDNWTQDQYS